MVYIPIYNPTLMSAAELNETFIRRVGSPFALVYFHCELTRTAAMLAEAKSTSEVVRRQLLGNEAVTVYHNFELDTMFELRLNGLEAKATAMREAIDKCYRLDIPGEFPGTQEQLSCLSYFEYTIAEAEGDLRRWDVREGRTS